MSERIRLDPKAVESAVMEANSEGAALIAVYRMVYPNWEEIESIGSADTENGLTWPACNETTWKRICRFFMDLTDRKLNQTRAYDKQVMGGGVWMNNGFTCHGDVAKALPDWWVMPAPVKLKEKVTA